MSTGKKVFLRWIAIIAALAAILGFYARIQVNSFTPTIGEPDTQAYLFLADRMARGLPLEVDDFDPFRYQYHMWVENHHGLVTTKFAPGMPLIMAGAQRVAGPEAVFWVNPIMGGLGLIGAFMLFRRWMSDFPALAATATIAFNPLFEFHAGYTLTHIAEMCLAVWGAFFLWRWMDALPAPLLPMNENTSDAPPQAKRFGVWWLNIAAAAAAGLLLGYATSVRYTSVLLAIPMLTAIGIRLWRDRAAIRLALISATVMLAAYSLTPIWLMVYNNRLFGSPFRTGYSLSGEQDAFGWSYFVEAHRVLFIGLYDLAPLVVVLALIGLLFAGRPRDRVLRALFILPLYGLYASYYWAPDNGSYYRFLICVIPFLAGSAFALLDQQSSRWRNTVAILLAAIVAYQSWPPLDQGGKGKMYGFNWVAASVRKVQAALPGNAVVFVGDDLSFHLAVTGDQRVYAMAAFRGGRAWWPYREKWAPRVQPIRKHQLEELYQNVNVDWLNAKRNRMIADFLDHGRTVAFVIPAAEARNVERSLSSNLSATTRESWAATAEQNWVILEIKRR